MRLGRGHAIGSPEDPTRRAEIWLPALELAQLDAMRQTGESRGDVVRQLLKGAK